MSPRGVANTGAKPTARPASGGTGASAGARGHEPNDEPRSERTDSRRRRSERHTPRSREETPASSFGGEKPRGAPGFYNPTFYERKYDLGEARGVSTYERAAPAGTKARGAPSEAQRRARTEGPYAGHGMDYEPKRVSEYRRMLGEGGAYYKLGSLGGDLDTEAQRAAREKREAIKELDRVNREQNRLAAERSNANMAKKRGIPPRGADGGAANRLEKGFLSHVGDRDPRNPGKNQAPSKHERMWSYAKRHIPKPVPAPPKKAPPAPPRMHGVWKEPAGGAEAFAAAPEDNNFRGEWPSAWGARTCAGRTKTRRAWTAAGVGCSCSPTLCTTGDRRGRCPSSSGWRWSTGSTSRSSES